ncbi:MAG TPA: galactose oxidase-like domain-containing protein [Polyangiaceae bacterium]|nr:galactose oxidase-like domain-containing protein [Polyangiaceae bacterium]
MKAILSRALAPALVVFVLRSAAAQTQQRFDGDVTDAPYGFFNATLGGDDPGSDAVVLEEEGNGFLRLADEGPEACHNSVTFAPVEEASSRVVADFAFRITPETGEADGFGFALLDASVFPAGAVPPGLAEEPSFTGSIGVGFDIFQSCLPKPGCVENPDTEEKECPEVCDGLEDDPAGHHISIHYGGKRYQFANDYAAGLVVGGWTRARVVVEFGNGGAWISVILAPPGAAACTAIDRFRISGVQPYDSRVWFGARTGGTISLFDLDDVEVTPFEPEATGAFGAPHCGPMVPIHAVTLPDGRVLAWDRHDYNMEDAGPWIVEPSTGSFMPAAHPGFDAFCAGHTFLADGNLFLAGGHWYDNVGVERAMVYDVASDRWLELPPMNDGRWYPTTTVLGDGSVLVLSGTFSPGAGGVNGLPQIWQPAQKAWRDLDDAIKDLPLYPWAYSAPDGRVFVAGPQQLAQFLDTSGSGAWQETVASGEDNRDYGSSVSYAPGKILIAGGSPCDPAICPPVATAEVIDLNGAEPAELAWSPVASMARPRRHFTLVTLADGKVLAVNGTSSLGFSDVTDAVLVPELWDPATPEAEWEPLERAFVPRAYHQAALLLPDGRVWIGGGGHPAPAAGVDQPSFEIYNPPYLFQGPRPEIHEVPASIGYGQGFRIRVTSSAPPVVNLVRLGAVTHDFDESALFVGNLTVSAAGGEGELDVGAPADRNTAPPGPYLLFALDQGVPSHAAIVLLGDSASSAGGEGGAGGAGDGGTSGAGATEGVGQGGAPNDTGGKGGTTGDPMGSGGAAGAAGTQNQPPVAFSATLIVKCGTTVAGHLNAIDSEGLVSFTPGICAKTLGCKEEGDGTWVLTTKLGVLTLEDHGAFTYQAKEEGSDSFDFVVKDSEGAEAEAVLTFNNFVDERGDDGCDCRTMGGRSSPAGVASIALLAALALLRRRPIRSPDPH